MRVVTEPRRPLTLCRLVTAHISTALRFQKEGEPTVRVPVQREVEFNRADEPQHRQHATVTVGNLLELIDERANTWVEEFAPVAATAGVSQW